MPERYLGDAVLDFKRVHALKHGASMDELNAILETYRSDMNPKGTKET